MNDDFEQQMARCRLRPAPENLSESLLAALRPRLENARPPAVPVGPVEQIRIWLSGISPVWRSLAAVWAVGLTVNHFSADAQGAGSTGNVRLVPEQVAAARAERAELLVLAGLREPEPEPVERPRVVPPRPRSSLPPTNRPNLG